MLLIVMVTTCAYNITVAQSLPVVVQAESGTLGSDYVIGSQAGVQYVSIQTNGAGQNPGNSNRVISYTVSFPQPGTYDLYARIRVGPAAANDDSYYYGNGFGTKSPSNDADWITANNLNTVGFTLPTDVVTGGGQALTNVWKWINMSKFDGGEGPVSFTVTEGNLIQTFQVGAREDGLDIDKFAFGLLPYYFTVTNLDSVSAGSMDPPPQPYVPTGPPMAKGKPKFVGGVYSPAQLPNFNAYWNQVVPENAGKWGSVEGTRDVMNWTELDAAYKLAKDSSYPFRMHVMVWGNQQPAWIENLPSAEQLEEINEWFSAVAQRYPAIDFLEVVNEPTNDPPNQPGNGGGNYIEALGGSGVTGWDWVLNAFRMARRYFPNTKLMLNDYNVENNPVNAQRYLGIINLLKQENLIDAIGLQGHAFSTRVASPVLTTSLDLFAGTGLPLYITELDIDGPTDQIQLQDYQRIFPLFWEHPGVKGITLWGYRPGHWRTAQGAYLVYANGAERPAMVWLKSYVESTQLTVPVLYASFTAQRYQSAVTLKWTTASEQNNHGFFIERKAGDEWLGFAFVPSQALNGNSPSGYAYTYTDINKTKTISYYRIAQTDRDGRKDYSVVQAVPGEGPATSRLVIYPNPSDKGAVNLSFNDALVKDVTVSDASGKTIRNFSAVTNNLQIKGLQAGIYFVRVADRSNAQPVVEKIVVR